MQPVNGPSNAGRLVIVPLSLADGPRLIPTVRIANDPRPPQDGP